MASFATKSASVLARLKKRGIPITFTRTTDNYNVTTGVMAQTPSTYILYGFVLKPDSGHTEQYDPGTTDTAARRSLFVSSGVVTPLEGDVTILFGRQWVVMAIDSFVPDGVNQIFHRIAIRRS